MVDSCSKTLYNGYMLKGKGYPLLREIKMKKLGKFLDIVLDPELFAAVGLIVCLIVCCVFGGH